MKRIFVYVLAAALCFGLSGCSLFDGLRYIKAMELYEEGAYGEAMTVFTELADYSDSHAMAQLCRQNIDYAQAEALFAAGEYAAALELYEGLSPYEDSPMKAVRCRYALGEACMNAGDYAQAYDRFRGLEGYEDAAEKAEQARWLWLWDHLMEAGPVQRPLDPEGSATLSLSALEEGRLLLTYTAEGTLLDIPYADRLDISFGHYGAQAVYEALSVSQAATTITEEAAGPLHTGSFLPGQPVELDRFRQTLTPEDKDPVISEDPEQMLLIKGLFSAAQSAVQTHLEALVAEIGLPVTVRDLGFVISQ